MSTAAEISFPRTDPEAAIRFIDRLVELRPDAWLVAGATASRSKAMTAAALAVLEGVIAHHRLDADAWSIGDDVEAAASWSCGSVERRPAAESATLAAGKRAATVAALALLSRPMLSNSAFARLYWPYAALIPLAGILAGAV